MRISTKTIKEIYFLCKEGFDLSEIARSKNVNREVVYAVKNKLIYKKIIDKIDKKLKKRRLLLKGH